MLILFFVLGLCFGSFGNVLVFRTIEQKDFSGRSRCMKCSKILRWFELVPVFSFLVQKAKCRACEAPLSWQYPLLETASGILFVLTFLVMKPVTQTELLATSLTSLSLFLLLVIGMIDAKTNGIPDMLSIPLLLLGVGVSFLLGHQILLPILLGSGAFAIQWVVSRGRAIGSGDILLGAGIGALLGDVRYVFVWLLLSYIVGGGVAGWLLFKKKTTMNSIVPFGPMLAGAGMVMVLWGDRITAILGL